jgi:hypothetical protein
MPGTRLDESAKVSMSLSWAHLAFHMSLPIAGLWVLRQERRILKLGAPLHASLLADARLVGVRCPERVRLLAVDEVPPMNPVLRFFARRLGLCSPHTSGMSLRYGIFIRSDCWGERELVIHELAHTVQYERLGGIRPFLKLYLYECLVTPGYPFGPLEQEAKEVEQKFSE